MIGKETTRGWPELLKYEGHMLIYHPHTNGAGWVAMKGIPSSLTEVKVRSAGDLGNFYPVPCPAREDPQTAHGLPQKKSL